MKTSLYLPSRNPSLTGSWSPALRRNRQPGNRQPLLTAILFAFIFTPLPSPASHTTPEVIHVKTTTSSSGHYHFEVDPSSRYGAGPSRCTLTENNRTLWSAEVPFTFYETTVLENGTVAGYGYTHGKSGFAFNVPPGIPNEIHAAIFDPAGKKLLTAKFLRQHGSYPGSGYVPSISGILLHEDLFILRIPADKDDDVEDWHRYRLSTGETLDTVHPGFPAPVPAPANFRCWLPEARVIPGTTLTANRWMYFDDTANKRFTIFNLTDLTGKSVWELPPLPWLRPQDEDEADHLDHTLDNDGAITIPPLKQFELWSPCEKTRTLYSVEGQPGAWKVQQLSQRPYTPPSPPTPGEPAPLTVPEPKPLGTFFLDTPPPNGPVYSVGTFSFDDRGRIGFLRDSAHFILVEQNGTLLAEVPLTIPAETQLSLVWTTGDRWLITASGYGEGSKASAWWVDAAAKSLTEVPAFDCPPVESLAAFADGGFVALTNTRGKYSIEDHLIAFDAAGHLRWKIPAENNSDPNGLLSPDCLTVTTGGEIAVLDNIRGIVVFFDAAGKQLRTTNLAKAWKRKPNYPSFISADKNNGLIIGDFHGQPPFVCMTAVGKVRTKFSPRFKDGRPADQSGEIRAAPDGRLWLNNRHSLLRLDDKARASAVLGQQPDSSTIGVIAGAACDDTGRLCAVDAQTGAVHVFDENGRRLAIRRPDKKDTAGPLLDPKVVLASDGRIILDTGRADPHYIAFGSDGKRIPFPLKTDTGDEVTFRQAPGGYLRRGFDEVTLTDSKGNVQQTITRQPDKRWLDFAVSTAVAPDGSFAILAGPDTPHSFINFYASGGTPLRTLAAPVPGSLYLDAWTGTHLLLHSETAAILCDADARPLLRLPAPSDNRAQFLTRQGREWWTLDFTSRKITRYALP